MCKLNLQITEKSIYGKLMEHPVYAYVRMYMVAM